MSYLLLSCSFCLFVVTFCWCLIGFRLWLSVYRLLLFTGDRLLARNGYLRSLVAIFLVANLLLLGHCLLTSLVDILLSAVSQKWIDSSISKTANVPTEYAFENFKDIYLYAYEQGLKGCTTFRFNPEAFQGVLVKEQDLENTTYQFELEDGEIVELKGNEEIEYDGEMHSAANLFDAMKEGYYGKF